MYPLAIDIGTTNIKFQLFKDTELIKELSYPIETYREEKGKVYQRPETILGLIQQGIRELSKLDYPIKQLVFSTAMHSIMPVFEGSTEEEELYIWQDSQATSFIQMFKETDQATSFYQKTGTPVHEMSPFAKIGFFKGKNWFNQVTRWIGLKEYLMYQLTGEYILDYSMASATGLFNIHEMDWDQDVLTYLGITRQQLARLVDTNSSFVIKKEWASRMGLSDETHIFIGASDGCLASYGSYLANGTLNTLSIGTSGAIRKLSRNIVLNEEAQTFCYYLNRDYWVIGGVTNNGGQVLDWADRVFFGNERLYSELNTVLQQTKIGSNGLLFLPYINGERSPLWNANALGSFSGVNHEHGQADMVRSVVEGILFNLRFISEALVLDVRDLTVNGGFFQHDMLTMMTADIFGKHCVQSRYSEATFGAIGLLQPVRTYSFISQERTFCNSEHHHQCNVSYEQFLSKVKNEHFR